MNCASTSPDSAASFNLLTKLDPIAEILTGLFAGLITLKRGSVWFEASGECAAETTEGVNGDFGEVRV